MKKTVAMLLSIILLSVFYVTSVAAETTKEKADNTASTSALSGNDLFPFEYKSKWGYMDKTGKVIIKPKYDFADFFYEKRAAVGMWIKDEFKFGYIATNGDVIVPLKYDSIYPFKNGHGMVFVQTGYAMVEDDGEIPTGFYYYVDSEGKRFWKTDSDSPRHFYQGVVPDGSWNRRWSLYNKEKRVIAKLDYSNIGEFNDGLAYFLDKKYGYIDVTGKVIIKNIYDGARDFSEGYAPVEKNGKWGYIDKKGKVIIYPQFSYAKSFSEGIAAVEINGKWGFIDTKGNIVIQPKYDDVNSCYSGLIMIMKEDPSMYPHYSHYIDLKGNVINPNI